MTKPAKRVNATSLYRAMGNLEGDYLVLSNQWAKVQITQEDGKWWVTGDLADLRAKEKKFPALTDAMAYALQSLGEYQEGACR